MATRKKKTTPYGMNDTLPFGQYRDRTVGSVARENPKYLDWLWATAEFDFEPEVWAAMKKAKAEQAAQERKTA